MNAQCSRLGRFLCILVLAALTAAGFTAQAQYVWTTLDDPLAGVSAGPNTLLDNFWGTNITGGFGYYFSGSGSIQGLVLCGTNWTTLVDPSAGSDVNQGTYATAMSGANISGWFVDSGGVCHGFLANGPGWTNWTTLDEPEASGLTLAQGIDGSNISGYYADANSVYHGFLYNIASNTWTTLTNPFVHGSGYGTVAFNISGSNIVGTFYNSDNVNHGFLYNGSTWMTLNDPNAGSASGQGTYALGIEGNTIAGAYIDNAGTWHGYLATPVPQLSLAPSGNAFQLSWPYWNNSLTGWSLQQNPDLTTTNWTPSDGPIYGDGTNNFISITPPAGNLFFRLGH